MKRTWPIGAAVIVVVALAAWLFVGRSRKGDTVAIMGDSITVVSEDALRKKLADFTLDFHAISGLRTDQLQGAAERAAASRPKQVIINLGTNGVLQGRSVEQMKADLDTMITTFSSAECIHVVTLNARMMTRADPGNSTARGVNDAIEDLVAAHPNVDKIDWNKVVESNERTGKNAVTLDTIHPNAKGKLLLAEAYAKATRNCRKPIAT